MVHGQVIIKTGDDGALKCNQYTNIDEDVQKLMTEWLTKTRRKDCEQSWGQEWSEGKNTWLWVVKKEKVEGSRQRINISFSSEESERRYLKHFDEGNTEFTAAASQQRRSEEQQQHKEENTERDYEWSKKKEDIVQQQEAQRRIEDGATRKGCSSTGLLPEKGETKPKEIAFTYLQKKTPDQMSSTERFEELLQEVQGATLDVILVSETCRPNKEVWESNQGHVVMESGKFVNKHGVAIIVNSRWKNRINWVECGSERVIAASISVNKHSITFVSTYMPRSGYPDHQVERTYEAVRSVIEKEKTHEDHRWRLQRWIGSWNWCWNKRVSVITLSKEANSRDEWDVPVAFRAEACRVEHHVQETETKNK